METKITAFDKDNLKMLRVAIDDALATVAAKYGLRSAKALGMSFSPSEVKITVMAQAGDPGADQLKVIQAHALGFKPSILGATCVINGHVFTITGFARSKVLADGPKGPGYTLPLDQTKRLCPQHVL